MSQAESPWDGSLECRGCSFTARDARDAEDHALKEHGQKIVLAEPEFDPRSLSKRDWDIIQGLLRDRGHYLQRRSEAPDITEDRRRELETAARRRFELLDCVARMKKMFTTELDSSQELG